MRGTIPGVELYLLAEPHADALVHQYLITSMRLVTTVTIVCTYLSKVHLDMYIDLYMYSSHGDTVGLNAVNSERYVLR